MERTSGAIVVVVFASAAILITIPPNSASAANLTILVPLKMGFNEFVKWEARDELPITPDSELNFSGFVVEVFRECIKRLDYSLDYTLVGFGDGINDPSYAGIVQKLVSGVCLMGQSWPKKMLIYLSFFLSFLSRSIISPRDAFASSHNPLLYGRKFDEHLSIPDEFRTRSD
jgi:hypothetical protein